jgi:carbonic anhydrase|tara:strand:- start:893 stop:1285 length:393 start_codon:yes stop_codon:yes gene_type:complete
MKKNYKAMVLTCIDPRCQPKINSIMKNKKLIGKYSLFSIAGSTLGITSKNFKNWEKVFWKNFSISSQIHGIKKLIVINHYDCSFAKMINKKKFFNNKIEKEIHVKSFKLLKKRFLKRYPKFKLETKIISV